MKKERENFPIMPPPRKELNDNPVKLCHDITRLSRAKAREANIDGVLSQPGARLVLALLAINDGVSQRTLVSETHLRPPTVSVIIGKMKDEGMVELRRNPTDRRETRIYLTDYGREVDMKGIANIKAVDALAIENISEEEQKILMSLLEKIRKNLIDSLEKQRKEETE